MHGAEVIMNPSKITSNRKQNRIEIGLPLFMKQSFTRITACALALAMLYSNCCMAMTGSKLSIMSSMGSNRYKVAFFFSKNHTNQVN